jgi:hypothetical protein
MKYDCIIDLASKEHAWLTFGIKNIWVSQEIFTVPKNIPGNRRDQSVQ